VDADSDGYSSGSTIQQCADPGANYYTGGELTATSGDCNDSDPILNPTTLWYKDTDGDDYSDGVTQQQCVDPGASYYLSSDVIALTGDCNDSDALLTPLTLWYVDADSDARGNGTTQQQCVDP